MNGPVDRYEIQCYTENENRLIEVEVKNSTQEFMASVG